MKKILVTGCAGFIGSNLCEVLLKDNNYEVIGVDNFDLHYAKEIKENNIKYIINNPKFKLITNDIRNKEIINSIFSNNEIDTVIHFAAKAGVRNSFLYPEEYTDVNINGTVNILNCMKDYNVKNLIFASSSSVYGNCTDIPFKETSLNLKPISPYAMTKYECEKIINSYTKKYNMNAICLRLFTVYGERQRPDLAISKFTRAIIENKPIQIYGDGYTVRDYTHICDIISGITSALHYKKTPYEIINLGSSRPIKLINIATLLENILCKKAEIIYLPMQKGDVNLTYANISKAKRLLNYIPTVKFEEGLERFVKNFLESWK